MRMRMLQEEFGDDLEIEWRAFLLRPRPEPGRSLEKFREYTRSWQRPAADPDGGEFRTWQGDAGPPSHSVPPHLAAKAAARLGPDAFRRLHERLYPAYFRENRDITDAETLRALWREAELPEADFPDTDDPSLLQRVIEEHNEALEFGASGVPAFRMHGIDAVITGAQPLDTFRRWVQRVLEARG